MSRAAKRCRLGGIPPVCTANLAKPIVEQLKTSGSIKRGWIGVRIQTVTPEIAATLGLTETHGALVAGVAPGAPAAAAGIETGDLITSFNGQKVREMRDLPRIIESEAVASVEHNGPFGAKGVGESATFGVSPAIANALEDAVGVRLTTLPLKPEAILRALRRRDGQPLAEEP